MKKLVFLLVCVFTVSTVAMADNEKPIQVGQLPTKAQTFITTYFKGKKWHWPNKTVICSANRTM